jgi:cyclohexyl-isocyanide hydratase
MNTRRGFLRDTLALAGTLAAADGRATARGEAPDQERTDPPNGGRNMGHHLNIGAIVYPRMDQIDFTGPFEVLSRLPDSTFHVAWKEKKPVRDCNGLLLTPEKTLAELPALDVLVVPGGPGQEDLMEDETVLSFLRDQAARARCVFSVCTGALVCGAAGLLKGVRATTHWGSFHLLEYFGAVPVNQRVVVDGKLVTAAGVTAGLDGALRVAALLRGDRVAQGIQLGIEYAPEPPFNSGTPASAPAEVRKAIEQRASELTAKRLVTAKRVASKLGVRVKVESGSRE